MPPDIPKDVVTELLIEVLKIQKQYAHEQTGARNDRRNQQKKIVNKIVAERLENYES